jgi:FHA domain-containing protein
MITITVTAHNAKALSQPLSANFDESGGTIGRAPENTLVLLDPDRKISRTHATVSFRDGQYILRDQGSVVPVVLNQQPLGNGREAPIKGGDEIGIGAYTLGVSADADTARAGVPAAAPGARESAAADDSAPSQPAGEVATDDEARAPTMEPVVSWATGAAVPGEGITTVVLTAADGQAPAERAAPQAPVEPPEIAAAAGAAAPPAPVQPVAAATNETLLRALLAGAGLRDVDIPGGLTPQLMHELGSLMREATRGLLDLLAARASAKRQVRADMTVIVASNNNPLKFAPDIEAALKHLLVPRGRGFMPPLRAVTDAYDDLRSHHQGFMAGMRSSLAIVVARFNPEELEKRLTEYSMVDSFLPTNRKAKLWDQFEQLYAQISREAESDFHTLFGEEFLRAYREHAAQSPARGNPTAGH